MMLDQFRFREPALSLFVNRQKASLFRWITKKAPPLFLCGGDVMTVSPMVTGYHEPEVLHVLAFLAQAGFGRAMIDVGANIGLMTFHCRGLFQSFHCFEPNPRMFNILQANLLYAFGSDAPNLHLHNFGLGDRDEVSLLTVPHQNQGGAFIPGPANAYSADILQARKRVAGGVHEISVVIRRGRDIFRELFSEMPTGGFVVKIDTEGFEQTIIREIAAATPPGARIGIVFENLQPGFNAVDFLQRDLNGAGTALMLTDNIAMMTSRIGKEITKLIRGKEYRLTDRPPDWVGTVVLILER